MNQPPIDLFDLAVSLVLAAIAIWLMYKGKGFRSAAFKLGGIFVAFCVGMLLSAIQLKSVGGLFILAGFAANFVLGYFHLLRPQK